MTKVIKGKDGVLGIVMHEHLDGVEVLFVDSIEEQLSWVDTDEIDLVELNSDEYLSTLAWHEQFNLAYNR